MQECRQRLESLDSLDPYVWLLLCRLTRRRSQRQGTPRRQWMTLGPCHGRCKQTHGRLQCQLPSARVKRASRWRSNLSVPQPRTLQSHHAAILLSRRQPCRPLL